MKSNIVVILVIVGMIVLSGCVEDTSTDSLIEDLGSENTSVAINAMDSLVEIGDENTIQSLIQVMENKNETIVKRENAIVVLGRIGDNETAGMLLNIAMNEEEKSLRRASILAIGDIGNETALESLRGLDYGDDGLVLYHAAYVLDQLEESYEVFATYGELPYPLTDQQRLYRNNAYEISRASQDDGSFPIIENASTVFVGYNTKSGYIEVISNVRPETSVMDEIYQIYDNEAKKMGVDKVPVRFVHGESSSGYATWWIDGERLDWSNVSWDINIFS